MRRLHPFGMGLIEILVAITCFLIAAVPLMGIFSFNAENSKVIHARSISFMAAQEVLNQVCLTPVASLTAGEFSLPVSGGKSGLGEGDASFELVLTEIPKSFTRSLKIENDPDDTRKKITVKISFTENVRANLELTRTIAQNLGGRQ